MTYFTPIQLATIWFSAYAKKAILGHSPVDCKSAAFDWLDGLFLTHEEKKPLWSFFERMGAGEKLEFKIDVHGKEYDIVTSWDRANDSFPKVDTQFKLL